ncbi:hypothetical protein BH09GEM1_BH09GEM1_12990 [soil metagenome]
MSADEGVVRESASVALGRLLARASAAQSDDSATRKSELEARARALARPLDARDASAEEDELNVLVFLVAGEQLAIPLSAIVAIVRLGVVTPLPRAAAPVYGVTAWRGRPLTVLSVGASVAQSNADEHMIVLGDGRRAMVGLRADTTDDTRVVRRSLLSPAQGGARGFFAMGVTTDAVLVLDADAMLNSARPEP